MPILVLHFVGCLGIDLCFFGQLQFLLRLQRPLPMRSCSQIGNALFLFLLVVTPCFSRALDSLRKGDRCQLRAGARSPLVERLPSDHQGLSYSGRLDGSFEAFESSLWLPPLQQPGAFAFLFDFLEMYFFQSMTYWMMMTLSFRGMMLD